MGAKAILEVTGCCGRYRAQMIIKLDEGQIVTLDALGRSAQAAYGNLIHLAGYLSIPDFDPKGAKVKHWTQK